MVILTEEQYSQLMNSIDEYQKAVINALCPVSKTVLGVKAKIISGSNGNYSDFDYMSLEISQEIEDMDESVFYEKFGYDKHAVEAWGNIKFPEGVFYHSIDF